MKKTFLILMICLEFNPNVLAQFDLGLSYGTIGSLSTYLDSHLSLGSLDQLVNKTYVFWDYRVGIEAGYNFKGQKFRLQTGLNINKFGNILYFGEFPISYAVRDFGKIPVTYRVYEIPLNLQYKVVRLNEKSSIGGILGCSFFLTYDPALFGAMENRITRYNKELKETGILDYLIQRDAYHEIGFGLNAGVFYKLKLTKNLDLMSNAQYSLGLKPGATFFFLYEISDSTNKTYGDAVSYSNWDNISMTVSILYNLRKRNNKR